MNAQVKLYSIRWQCQDCRNDVESLPEHCEIEGQYPDDSAGTEWLSLFCPHCQQKKRLFSDEIQ